MQQVHFLKHSREAVELVCFFVAPRPGENMDDGQNGKDAIVLE